MRALFVSKSNPHSNIWEYSFEPAKIPRYIAGQFVELSVNHEHDNRGSKRWFTLTSAPHEKYLSVRTRLHDKEPSAFKKYLQQIKAGEQVDISMPMGDFVMPKNADIPIIMLSSGIGYTPFLSILKDLAFTNAKRDIKLLHISKETEHNLSEFKNLKSNYIPLISHQKNEIKPLIDKIITDEHYLYISGPEQFVEDQVENLKEIKRSQIFTDFFHGY